MLRGKRVVIIIVCLMILTLPSVAYADTYKDEEAQIEFTVPEGWTEEALSKERDIIKVKYVYDSEAIYTETIMFGYSDLFGALTEEERAGVTRSEFDNSCFTLSDVALMYGVSDLQVQEVYYNNVEYFEVNLDKTEAYGMTFDASTVNLIRFFNGYGYVFSYFYWMGFDDHYSDFEDMMSTVKYLAEIPVPTLPPMPPTVRPVSTYYSPTTTYTSYTSRTPDLSMEGLILSLIITVAVYSLPIIIYRYAIRKRAMEKKKAKRVTVIYGIIAFIGMSILLYSLGYGVAGGAIIFWSWVNYKMLTSGVMSMSQKEINAINGYTGPNASASQSIRFTSHKAESDFYAQAEQAPVNGPGPMAPAEIPGIVQEGINEDEGERLETAEEYKAEDRTDIIYENGTKEVSVLQQIEQLNRLYEKGALTKEEFKDAKKRLLDKL